MATAKYSKVDEYGFERPDDFDYKIYETFISNYMKTLTRRALRWNTVFKNLSFKKTNTLKRFVRKGVPANLRMSCWMAVSGAEKYRKNSSMTYQQMKNSIENCQFSEIIKIDLPRTFPDNIFFMNEANLPNMLYNVLATFAQQNTDVGYCQGLNYIGGKHFLAVDTIRHLNKGLLLLATKDEAVTFWLLKTLVEQILPNYYVKTMSGLLTDLDVMNELVFLSEPLVCRHIYKIGMPWAMGITKWFICLYADVLPTETVLRIWDCLFFEGSKILFRVALTLIKLHREKILQTHDLSELMAVFRNMKNHPRVLDCHTFMNDVFEMSGSLPSRKIEKLRAKYKKDA